jgi:hypothetical protein
VQEECERGSVKLKRWQTIAWIGVAAFGVCQLVPYGHDHQNPPVLREPAWSSSELRALAVRACFDCHSNQTRWPWYSNVAPVSWLVFRDVRGGRAHLNFSEWDRKQRHAVDAASEVEEREMPMAIYPPLHPEARLSDGERATLVRGLEQTLGRSTHDKH